MQNILIQSFSYIAIILLGIFLRRIGYFKPEDFTVLSKIAIRITLPSSIVVAFSQQTFDPDLLVIMAISIGCGALYMAVGYLLQPKGTRSKKAFSLLNLTGYNIGNFTMPFTRDFLGPIGAITTSLFDTGNACICLGGAYGIAASVKEGSGFDMKRIIKGLASSIPFMTHLTMVLLNLFRLVPPAPIVGFAQIVGNGNAFLAMLMIGVGFNLSGDRSQFGSIFRVLSVRYGLAAILALAFYFLLPFDLEVRQALVILSFSPIGSAVPIFTAELKGDVGLSAAINSISILMSIVIIVTLLIVML